jgi:hypothetical protein
MYQRLKKAKNGSAWLGMQTLFFAVNYLVLITRKTTGFTGYFYTAEGVLKATCDIKASCKTESRKPHAYFFNGG